jgi:polar amino acid transport system substrate-binding protein
MISPSAFLCALAAPTFVRRLAAAIVLPCVLEPAYMAIALPAGSPLKKPLDEALVGITASQERRQVEDGYFGRQQ